MGEARRRQAELRDSLLRQADRWSFPATEWERAVVAELGRLPVLRVPKASEWWLRQTRMVPQECHANVRFMVVNHPDRGCEHVTGWMPMAGEFVLHSVVRYEGELVCVTPAQPFLCGTPDHVEFIPDPLIEWRPEGGGFVAYRDGVRVDVGVRTDPAETMRWFALVRGRLLEGMDPRQAVSGAVLGTTAPT